MKEPCQNKSFKDSTVDITKDHFVTVKDNSSYTSDMIKFMKRRIKLLNNRCVQT